MGNNRSSFAKEINAFILANRVHKGQLYGENDPYINHPLRVAEITSVLVDGEMNSDCVVAALLHDTIEDHPDKISQEDIFNRFGYNVQVIVEILTRRKEEPVDKYMDRVLKNEFATKIKLADMIDNLSHIETSGRSDDDKKRLREKYEKCLRMIVDKWTW